MIINNKAFGLLLVFTLVSQAAYAGISLPQINPGRWQIVIHQQIAGAAFPFLVRHRNACLTDSHPFPGLSERDCQRKMVANHDGTLRWRIHCTPPGAMPARGWMTIHYGQRRFKGVMHLKIQSQKRTQDFSRPVQLSLKEKLTGHYVGRCRTKPKKGHG